MVYCFHLGVLGGLKTLILTRQRTKPLTRSFRHPKQPMLSGSDVFAIHHFDLSSDRNFTVNLAHFDVCKASKKSLGPTNIYIKEQSHYMVAIFGHFVDYANTWTKHVWPYIKMRLVKCLEYLQNFRRLLFKR